MIAQCLNDLDLRFPGSGLKTLASRVAALQAESVSEREAVLLGEIDELSRAIEAMREDVARKPATEIATMHVPTATDELDAISLHTAAATEAILESCEKIDELAATMDAAMSRALQLLTMRIYEACSFQDITGQRISKIVATLKIIEATVVRARGSLASAREPRVVSVGDPNSLLNGPQLSADAMEQAEIDKLLADF
ncbi:MAG: hypothetical protein ACRYG8_38590 [Janthinobacterium lividum]